MDELGRTIGRLESELEGLERERRVLEESWQGTYLNELDKFEGR